MTCIFSDLAEAMAKSKTAFFCRNCGFESPKWQGKCPACSSWNTFQEEPKAKEVPVSGWSIPRLADTRPKLLRLQEIETDRTLRLPAADPELSRVLGGGIVPGSFILIGGEPGIGKSTLLLQEALAVPGRKVLYVSGEESHEQIRLRATRLGLENTECYILCETELNEILGYALEINPDLFIIDSIQTVYTQRPEGSPGSISQIRECTGALLRFAKEARISTFLIGHITKEGSIAGPKLLEHMVDTVLLFEGERHLNYRVLRTVKNRFGSSSEMGIYEMQGEGLRPVLNPSDLFLGHRNSGLSGVAIGCLQEGNRSLLIEIQSLVSPTGYATPQRSATGFDNRRLSMLLAVLEKRGGFRFHNQDVFLNVAGGLRVDDPALDLAACISLIASLEGRVIPSDMVFCGEVGLGGEIRSVTRLENRLAEADRLGFQTIYIPGRQESRLESLRFGLRAEPVAGLGDLLISLFTGMHTADKPLK